MITNLLPATAGTLSATISRGSITSDGKVWTVGNLGVGAAANATIVVLPTAAGTLTATTMAAGNQFDPIPANNVATVSTVVGPAADLSIGISEYPNPAVVTSNLTYVFSVSNAGPSTATGVAVIGTLPASVNPVSTNASQGLAAISGTTLTWNLGTLNRGSAATLTIVGRTTTGGTFLATANVAGSEPDPNLANNSASLTTVVAQPGVTLVSAGATLTSESFVPPNGAIDVGETVTVILRLRNSSNSATLNLVGTLSATNGVVPVPPNNPQTYGVVAASGFPVGRSFSFTANGTNGQTISAVLQLQDGTNAYPPVSFPFTLSTAHTFANTNTILVPDPDAPNPPWPIQSGPGKPYRRPDVGDLGGVLGKVTVTVSHLTHTYPGDVNLLLVSPNGTSALLMSHAGNLPATNAPGLVLTFDDSAPSPLPADGQLYSGTWQATVYSPDVQLGGFPAPAPAGPYQSALSVFNAGYPTGTWSLYVFDDAGGDSGAISNGWSMTLSTITPVNQLVDLGVSGVASPSSALAGAPVTYTFTVANNGPSPATSVAFTNALPVGLALVSATPSQGVVLTNGNTVLANLGTLATGAVATVTVVAIPSPTLLPAGINSVPLTNAASAWPVETDPSPPNNTAPVVTTILRPVADLSLSQANAPDPVFLGNPLTNTIAVTNLGSEAALDVVLTDPLPTNIRLVSFSSTVGSSTTNGGTLTCSLGTVGPNMGATLTVVLIPLSPSLTNYVYTNAGPVTNISTAYTNAIPPWYIQATNSGPFYVYTNAGPVTSTNISTAYTNAIPPWYIQATNSGPLYVYTNAGPVTNISAVYTNPPPAWYNSTNWYIQTTNMVLTNFVSVTTASQNTGDNSTATNVTVRGPAPDIIPAGALLTHETPPVNALIRPRRDRDGFLWPGQRWLARHL